MRILGLTPGTYAVVAAVLALLAIPLVLMSVITVINGVVVGCASICAAVWGWRMHRKINTLR